MPIVVCGIEVREDLVHYLVGVILGQIIFKLYDNGRAEILGCYDLSDDIHLFYAPLIYRFDVLYKLNYTYFFTFVLTPKCQKDGKNQKKLKKFLKRVRKRVGN